MTVSAFRGYPQQSQEGRDKSNQITIQFTYGNIQATCTEELGHIESYVIPTLQGLVNKMKLEKENIKENVNV